MRVDLTGVFKHADNIVTRKVMDETLLVPISGDLASMEELYTLNDTGAFIWEALDGTATLAEIARKLHQCYDAPPEEIQTDMLEIMSNLAEVGLITPEN